VVVLARHSIKVVLRLLTELASTGDADWRPKSVGRVKITLPSWESLWSGNRVTERPDASCIVGFPSRNLA